MVKVYLESGRPVLEKFRVMSEEGAYSTQGVEEKRELLNKNQFGQQITLCQTAIIAIFAASILFGRTPYYLVAGAVAAVIPAGIWRSYVEKRNEIRGQFLEQCRVLASIFHEMENHLNSLISSKYEFLSEKFREKKTKDHYGTMTDREAINKILMPYINDYNSKFGYPDFIKNTSNISNRRFVLIDPPDFLYRASADFLRTLTEFNQREIGGLGYLDIGRNGTPRLSGR